MLKYSISNKENLVNDLFELCSVIEENNYAINSLISGISKKIILSEDLIQSLIINAGLSRQKSSEAVFSSLIFPNNNAYYWSNYIKNNFYILDGSKFKENPYIKNINLKKYINVKHNNIEIDESHFLKNEITFTKELVRDKNFRSIPSIGVLNDDITFPVLKENNDGWMSISPAEISTNMPHIDDMHGNVLIFGLGLGYFPYMCSLKYNISSITIVESNKDIIHMFKEYIFPQFNSPVPINIINTDCKSYFLKKDYMNEFDCCFIDIWKNTLDGIYSYIFFKENEKGLNFTVNYWLERDMCNQLEDVLCAYILNVNSINKSTKTPNYIKLLYKKVKNYFTRNHYVITDRSDLYKLILSREIIDEIFKIPL